MNYIFLSVFGFGIEFGVYSISLNIQAGFPPPVKAE